MSLLRSDSIGEMTVDAWRITGPIAAGSWIIIKNHPGKLYKSFVGEALVTFRKNSFTIRIPPLTNDLLGSMDVMLFY
jgi:hypothetical protein